MKYFLALLLLLVSFTAFSQSRTCEMSAGGNTTQIKLMVHASGAQVQLAQEEPDQCVLESSHEYEVLMRCGSDEDATYFGVKGTTGKVFEGPTTIAQLKKCKRL